MNDQIQEKNMYWRAGRTSISNLSFSSKELFFGKRYNAEGLDYYKGGIYRRLSDNTLMYSNSSLVESFDWRSRHHASTENTPYYNSAGTGWFTPVKDQEPDTIINGSPITLHALTCYVFSPVAAVEARHNLVYNIHPAYPNIDISEMDVWRCPTGFPYNQGGSQSWSFARLYNNYKVEENCFLYGYHHVFIGAPCSWKCTIPESQLCKIESWETYPYTGSNHNEDALKKFLIEKGPCSIRIKDYIPGIPNSHHYMVLAGYSIVKEGDIVYKGKDSGDPDIIIEKGSPIINTFFGYFKNSWGTDHGVNGFMRHQNTQDFWEQIYESDIFVPIGLVNWYNHNTSEIRCTDEDGDGYYWWGVNLLPNQCNCPPSVKEENRDCDDYDVTAGPYVLDPYDPEPLFSCTPVDCMTKEGKIDILDDETWSVALGDKHIDKNIIVHPGATLNINCQVFMTPGVKIIVQPGGKLNLEGSYASPARLTSGCGEFWGGVEVQGDSDLPQESAYQGTVIINFGILDNAITGIKTINAGAAPDGGGVTPVDGIPSGGIIQATGATFRNNLSGVEFLPYRDESSTSNISFFKGCTFETTKHLLGEQYPKNLLKLSGIDELIIKGCTFRNKSQETILPSERGYGIYLYNAELTLDTLHKLQNIVVDLPCNFDSLNYGVYAMSSNLGQSSLNVKHCIFKDNFRGLYASGFTLVNQVEIMNSEFYYLDEITSNPIYLLYMNNCTSLKVHQNIFMGTTNLTNCKFGVIVNNSGASNNYIYDNKFQRLTYGLQGLNHNRNCDAAIEGGVPLYEPTGLRFICNKFEDVGCTNDFLINKDPSTNSYFAGIAYNQRNAKNITDPTQEPAGNVFTNSHSTGNSSDYDINISSEVSSILYTHHVYPQGLDLTPDDVSNSDWVKYDARPEVGYYTEDGSCPDTFYPDGDITELRSSLSQVNQKIDSLINLLQILVDEGSTDSLRSTVENSTLGQSYDVYQELMSASPYLSDSVVRSSIEKEEVLPNAMIRDIMVANPQSAKSEELLIALDERTDPMPDSLWADILQGKDTIGAMERLIGELSGWMQRRDLYFNALLTLFINDTVNSWAQDSLIALCLEGGRLDSRYLLFQYYLANFGFGQASSIIQAIPSQYDLTEIQFATHQRIASLLTVLPQLFTDTLGYLVPDSLQKISLEQIAETDYDIPGAWARNFLIASGLLKYEEPVIDESTLKSSRKSKFQWTHSRSINSTLKVFPNPAKDYIIVEYKNENKEETAEIVIIDMSGKEIASLRLDKGVDQKVIQTHGIKAGTYLIQLQSTGSIKESVNIVIIR